MIPTTAAMATCLRLRRPWGFFGVVVGTFEYGRLTGRRSGGRIASETQPLILYNPQRGQNLIAQQTRLQRDIADTNSTSIPDNTKIYPTTSVENDAGPLPG